MPKSEVEVLIIGAGAAGIAAGRKLRDSGVDALLVEARFRIGGRAWTRNVAGHALDLGCGWLHSADHNPWVAITQAQGRTIDKTPPPWGNSSAQVGADHADVKALMTELGRFRDRVEALPDDAPDRPASAFLDPYGAWNGRLDAVSTYYSGAELDRVSARDLARYDDSGVNWRVPDGYGSVVAAHGAGLLVERECAVTRVDHRERLLRIETNRGVIRAAAVIVALPSALIARHADLFLPALPEKTQAATDLPLGLADKLYLALSDADAFAPESRAFGKLNSVATAAYQFRPRGAPYIEAYFGGELAATLEKGGESAFFDFAREELVGLFGADFARRVAPIAHHGWREDVWSRGSYSYALPGRADSRAILAAPVEGRIFFAGEACSTNDYSTAHGAYKTGIRAAEQVIAARAA
jgi:monoamine oxidase